MGSFLGGPIKCIGLIFAINFRVIKAKFVEYHLFGDVHDKFFGAPSPDYFGSLFVVNERCMVMGTGHLFTKEMQIGTLLAYSIDYIYYEGPISSLLGPTFTYRVCLVVFQTP